MLLVSDSGQRFGRPSCGKKKGME